ncbi:hypothetical protein BOTBODRAFT_66945 [Botryobasidium botryosum FD-172 SS1]|uniref:Major facilitator superfamily (MFS) profile domain-containing protein n=1 Tax=Botryobasidium botryosum (strain FD-172 SS1) TaxID=930990 RepID=A0A067MCD2_BOTB1|nr:hypothetical protein BOTBODRAFT_66945 [Botryobasidium botryosum FD-172 SS1]
MEDRKNNGVDTALHRQVSPAATANFHEDEVYRRALRKVDLVVVPLVTMFYFLSFIDRSNIGNARVAGLQADLKMTDHQYSTALTITYVPYIVWELPSNLLLKRLSPRILLPLYVCLWGLVSTLQGLVTSYSGLLVCRFFLGLVEGGLLPGILLYMSSFFPRHKLQVRVSVLFCATSLGGAFSGLLAAAIIHMDGIQGKRGWAWIFILEGIFSVAFGFISFFFLPSSPLTTKFLTQEERVALDNALKADGSGDEEHESFTWSEVVSACMAPQVIFCGILLFFIGTTLYGLAYFAPSIVNTLGYSATRTQLMTVPPYACSFVVNLLFAYLSDRYRQRGLATIGISIIAVIGYAMYLGSAKKGVIYAALFFQVTGAYGGAPTVSAWMANNVMPHYKRATAVAIGFIMSNSGGILSTWIFTKPPRYTIATRINLAFSVATIFVALANMLYLRDQNTKKAAQRAAAVTSAGETAGNVNTGEGHDGLDKTRLGDRHPNFIYTL